MQFFDRGYAVELHREFVDGRATEVHVGVVEAGHNEMAAELYGFEIFAGGAFEHDRGEVADADDFAVADGHGAGPGMGGIVGVDAAVEVEGGVGGRSGDGVARLGPRQRCD